MPFVLNFLIGLLLLAGLVVFYESTVIFYVMLHIHVALITACVGILFNPSAFIDEVRRDTGFLFFYIVPFAVQFSLAAILVFLRAALLSDTTVQDAVYICITPCLLLIIPFFIPSLAILIPPQAKFNIYDTFNIIGLVVNTLIIILGGQFGLFIYRGI